MTEAPRQALKIGDTRVRNGRVWRLYEIELEGEKWEDLGPVPALSSQGSEGDQGASLRDTHRGADAGVLALLANLEERRSRMTEVSAGMLTNPDGPEAAALIRKQAAEIDRFRMTATLPAPAPSPVADLVAALEAIVDLGSDGEHSGDRHARCRDIARAALSTARTGGVA